MSDRAVYCGGGLEGVDGGGGRRRTIGIKAYISQLEDLSLVKCLAGTCAASLLSLARRCIAAVQMSVLTRQYS